MNNNVNEQEMIMKQKIEKRERFDIVLAYILIAILVACIGIILYLRLIRKEENDVPSEHVPNYISLSEISSLLNTSNLTNRYISEGANLASMVSGNSIVITYTKEDYVINLNVPAIGSELMFTMNDDNSEIVTDIYKEVTNIVCVYYGNTEANCRNTIDNLSDTSSIDGIRYGDNNTVYVTTTKSIDVGDVVVYNVATKVGINDDNYILNLSGVRISDIKVDSDDTNIVFTGNIEKLSNDITSLSIIIKLYGIDGNILGENKQEYNEGDSIDSFDISFLVSDTLKMEDISEYIIEIVR